jgi:D-alanyl-D-alanine carboxypeptidase/D-alanyl-D-alanine-endopeptidase (penicillin-binding protein 4)
MAKYLLIMLMFLSNFLTATSREETVNRIRNILAKLPDGTKAGILIYNPLVQDTIFSLNPKEAIIPASLTKIFTTATAFNLMDANHKLSTKIFSDDIDFKDGVLNGNLYIKGFGNSTLTEADLQNISALLANKGIKKIEGNIVGDDTYFDDIYIREDWIENEKANVKLPPISALVLDRNRTTVKKKIRSRYRYITETLKDPPLFIANALKQSLTASGIDVTGTAKKGSTPKKVFFLTERYIVLKDLVALINKHSDNFFAECLFKTLGAEANGSQGNSFFSQQAIQKFLKDNNIYYNGTEIVDGSGISRFDHITPLAITGVLEKMYFDLRHFNDFYNSLSIAGVDGTLRGRMLGTFAENNFRGKTGSLNGVSGLAGYLTDKDGEDLIITIIFEYNKGGRRFYHDIQDQIVTVMTDWKEENSDQ